MSAYQPTDTTIRTDRLIGIRPRHDWPDDDAYPCPPAAGLDGAIEPPADLVTRMARRAEAAPNPLTGRRLDASRPVRVWIEPMPGWTPPRSYVETRRWSIRAFVVSVCLLALAVLWWLAERAVGT